MKIENIKEQQRELFDQFEQGEAPRKASRIFGKEKRFSLSVSFDMLLLYLILSLMVALLVYAAGVEIGRRNQRMLPVKASAIPLPRVKETQKPKRASAAFPAAPQAKPVSPPPAGVYTIQVASYRQTGPAEKAMEALKQKGYAGFILTESGSDKIAVCVGNFAKVAEAQPKLKELKSLHPDCFVRKR